MYLGSARVVTAWPRRYRSLAVSGTDLKGRQGIKERDERKLDGLRKDVRAGFEAIERGRYTEYDERTLKDLAKGVKARRRRS